MAQSEIIQRASGKPLLVDGIRHPSVKSLADASGIAVSTLKFRMDRGMTAAEAVQAGPSGKTSAKITKVDNREFRSIHAAASYAAERYGISHEQARYRIRNGIALSD